MVISCTTPVGTDTPGASRSGPSEPPICGAAGSFSDGPPLPATPGRASGMLPAPATTAGGPLPPGGTLPGAPIRTSGVPTGTVSPSGTRISRITPS
jgi:hypothetical protein